MQHLRVKLRWEAIGHENKSIKKAKNKGEKYYPEMLTTRDTLKELLVRCRYLLYKYEDEWKVN